jgi:hypothetical protein
MNDAQGCEIENQLEGFPRSARKKGGSRRVADQREALF